MLLIVMSKKRILNLQIRNEMNKEYNTNSGNDTNDYIFLFN